MKRILTLALVLTIVALAAAPAFAETPAQKTPPKAAAQKLYVCTMCDYATDKPGKCPDCGMNLQEVNKADVSYVCTMCNVSSDKPGKCPKCGMTLKMKLAEPKTAAVPKAK
jgi:rubrerythrin